MARVALTGEKIWFNKSTYDKAECFHYEKLAKIDRIAALTGIHGNCVPFDKNLYDREKQDLGNLVEDVEKILKKLDVEEKSKKISAVHTSVIDQVNLKKNSLNNIQDDNDINLFGSDSEDDIEAEKIREERVAAYEIKKSKRPTLTAKSNIILDVKPWDDKTDMKMMEIEVRKIKKDGLLWGAAKLVPVAYKIQKLQISCVVEDDKISVDWLTDQIQEIEDFVQSVDIAAFNKV